MNAELRVRLPKRLLEESTAVAEDIGTDVREVVRMALTQLVKRRALPFEAAAEPALAEYGVTAQEAERAFQRAAEAVDKERAAGRVVRFTGRLPADDRD